MNGRKEPKTILDCVPGDIVWCDEHGRILVTGDNQGKSQSVRFARHIDAGLKQGEIFIVQTNLKIRAVERLYTRGGNG